MDSQQSEAKLEESPIDYSLQLYKNVAQDKQNNVMRMYIFFRMTLEMESIKFVTYATHSQGMYNTLIENPYHVHVTVLGFGEKWLGYIESKIRGVLQFVNALDDKELVCYLDAFDTMFNKHPAKLLTEFKKIGADIVFSEDCFTCGKYLTRLKFGDCCGTTLNAGMFIGFAGTIKRLLELVTESGLSDDQLVLNKLCTSPGCTVDKDKILFQNLTSRSQTSDAIFVSYPFGAGQTIKYRVKRFLRDYSTQLIGSLVMIMIALCFNREYSIDVLYEWLKKEPVLFHSSFW